MVKPLSRTAYMGIVAGLTIYGTVVCGAIGAGAGALIDGGRKAYNSYAYGEHSGKDKDNLRFTSMGCKGFGGLGAIIFGFAGIVTASTINVVSRNKQNRASF